MRPRGTIIVTFYADITESAIEKYLAKEGLGGTRVSQLRNRYAVDVPVGKEEFYIDKLSADLEMVDQANPYFIRGTKEASYKPAKRECERY